MPRSPGRAALAEPLFRRYFLVSCLSTMGTWVSRFLLGWSAWELTHAALWVGITSTLLLIPTLVLSPLFGVISDRISPRNGLLVTLLSQGLLAAAAALALATGVFALPVLLTLALLLGAVGAAHQPLRLALMPRLVPREALPGAIGISAILFNLARILGPALAGWLLVSSSAEIAFLTATGLFAGAFTALLAVRGIEAAGDAGGGSMASQLREGLAFAASHDGIRLILLFTLVNGLLGRTVMELLPALSGKLLDGQPDTLALVTAAAGAGSICGGLLLARHRGDEAALLRMVLHCLTGSALVLLPLYFAHWQWSVVVIVFCLSLATTMAGTGSQALAQLLVSDALRGRILSLWTVVTMTTPALGALALGALADLLGFATATLGLALLGVLLAGLLRAPVAALYSRVSDRSMDG